MVYSLALRMLADRHKAEDVAQEAFLQLHRKLALVQSDVHLLFWLRQVATRLAINRLRREPRYETVPLHEDPGIAAEAAAGDPCCSGACADSSASWRRRRVQSCCCAIRRTWNPWRSPRCSTCRSTP